MLMGKQFYSVPFTTSKLVSSLPYKFTKLDERLSSHFCLQLIHLPVLPYSSTYLSLKKFLRAWSFSAEKYSLMHGSWTLLTLSQLLIFMDFKSKNTLCYDGGNVLDIIRVYSLKLLLFLKKYEVILKKPGVSIMDWWKSTQHAFINT